MSAAGGGARRSQWRVMLVLVVLTVGAYWSSLGGEFVVDDHLWATQPPPDMATVLERAFKSWGFRDSAIQVNGPPIFRPVSTLLTGLAHWSFAADPTSYRIASLALHCANGGLLWVLLGMLMPGLQPWARALPVAIFLLHPAAVEAVAWISSAAELYMSSFVLLALIAFVQARSKPSVAWRAGFVVCCALAMLSKEAALALPPILMLVQYVRRDSLLAPEIGWAVALALGYVVWRHLVIQGHGGADSLGLSPLRVLEFGLAHLRYLLLPAAQPFSIAPPDVAVAGLPALLLTGALLLMVGVVALRSGGVARRGILLGAGWMFFALWPAYAIALVGDGFFAGRHAYLPAAGLALMLAALLGRIDIAQARLGWAGGAPLLLYLAYATAQAGAGWSSNLLAYTRASELSPKASGAWAGIGYAQLDANRPAQAQAAFETALAQRNDRRSEQAIRYALAGALAQQQKYAQSDAQLQRLTELDARDSSAWNGLGNNAWMRGELAQAEHYYRQALIAEPRNLEAQRNLRAVRQAGATR